MKKLISTVLGSLLVSGLLLGFIYFGGKSLAYEPPQTDYVGQETAFWVTLPPGVSPSVLTSSLWCPRIETRSGKLILASLWVKLPSGKTISAQMQAYNIGGAIGWVVLVTGPRIFVQVFKKITDDQAAADAGTAKMLGPLPIKSLESKSAAVCKAVASKFLTPLTGVQDGGLPRSPYTEGGSWPSQEVLTCADGTTFRLQTAMNGHMLSSMNWTKLPPLSSWEEAPGGPLELLPCGATWSDPDAAVWKHCPQVPVGTTCAK